VSVWARGGGAFRKHTDAVRVRYIFCSWIYITRYIFYSWIYIYFFFIIITCLYIYILPTQKCFKLVRCHWCVTCVTPTHTACHIQTLAQRPHLNQISNPQKWKAVFLETGSKTTYKNEEVVLGIVYEELQVSSTSSSSRTLPPNPHLSGVGKVYSCFFSASLIVLRALYLINL